MNNQDPVSVTHVHWRKLLPWLNLLEAARLSFRMRTLVPAAVLLFASTVGPQPESTSANIGWQWVTLPGPVAAVLRTVENLAFRPELPDLRSVGVMLWHVLTVGLLGIAIARSSAFDFCSGTRVGATTASKFALQRTAVLLLSTGIAIVLTSFFVVPMLAAIGFGQLWSNGDSLPPLLSLTAGIFALLALVAGTVCLVGWFLALAAIGTDNCGGSDALSRGINYVLSHPWYTLWQLLIVILVSSAARQLADFLLTAGLLLLQSRSPEIFPVPVSDLSTALASDLGVLTAQHSLLMQLPKVVQLAGFLSGTTIMYVLLRQEEDGIQLRELDGSSS